MGKQDGCVFMSKKRESTRNAIINAFIVLLYEKGKVSAISVKDIIAKAFISRSTFYTYFDNIDDVPRTAITMGVGGIMKAKKIILIASGESKAEAIKGLFSGKITTENPASMLQMHRDVTVIVDKEAAKLIEN